MGLFDALFGKKPSPSPTPSKPDDSGAAGALIVVFAGRPNYSAADLRNTLRAMDASLRGVTVQDIPEAAKQGTPLNRVAWGPHVVDVVGMDVPMPKPAVENCVQPAHYGQDLKAAVRAHRAHALLYYSGAPDADPVERYTALAVVAAAFAKHGALAILHEAAMTSLPAEAVYELATSQPGFAVIRATPLLMLYCGFVKYFLPDRRSAWMRTYNNPAFGLPDLATLAPITQGQKTFDLFSALMDYLLDSGARFAPGHTAEFGETHLRFRAPRDNEPFPTHSAGQLLVVEITR